MLRYFTTSLDIYEDMLRALYPTHKNTHTHTEREREREREIRQ